MADSSEPLFTMPGVASGMDWGSMLDKVMEKARKPEEVWLEQKDTLELKIDLYKELSASIKQARTALTPLKLESTYLNKQAEMVVLSGGSSSDAIVKATVKSTAAICRHEIEVIQKATKETRFGARIEDKMEDLGLTENRIFYISAGGKRAKIEITPSDTLQKVVDKINGATDITLNADGEAKGEPLPIVAKILDNRLVLESTETGLGEKTFESTITRGADGEPDLLDFSIDKQAPANGALTVTQAGITYIEGVDFEVSQGGNEITWLAGGNKPAEGIKYNVSYKVNANVYTFDTEGEADGSIINILGLDSADARNYIPAQDAELVIDGMSITRSSNTIEGLIDGVTLDVAGPGTVMMDVTLDAEKAVTSTEEFITAYNDIMDWINIRLSEELVKDPASDFERKWGKLHGDSTLWQIKSQLRQLLGSSAPIPFNQRTGTEAILGTMADEGLTNDTAFSITIDNKSTSIVVKPGDTVQNIADRINSSSELRYDSNGELLSPPLATARVTEGRLVITAASNKQATVSDSSGVLGLLGLNDPYTQLSQLGITTEKADFGKSGKLEFDTDKFMTGMKKDPKAVEQFMTNVMKKLDEAMDGLTSSSTIATGGTSQPKGRISSQIHSWETEVKSIDKRISKFEDQLSEKQKRIYKQYTAAEQQLAKLQQQISWLSSVSTQLASQSQ